MAFIDTRELDVLERRPGWLGRYYDSESMSFGWYEFREGSTIHAHHHPQEEVWHVLEGELEITVDGVRQRAGPGCVAIVPAEGTHAVRALTHGRALVVDHPRRVTPQG